jgi:hypothetical protein
MTLTTNYGIDPDYLDPDDDGEPEPDDTMQSPPDWRGGA